VDIKHSTFKNLTAFLKWIEKDGLLKLKEFKGELNIIGINASHHDVLAHKPYKTIADKEKQEEKKALIEKADKERIKEIVVHELWKPHAQSIHFFEEIGKRSVNLQSSF
jgi:translation initiation factor 2D